MQGAMKIRAEEHVAVVPLSEEALSTSGRQSIMEALDRAEEDNFAEAIVLLHEAGQRPLGIGASDVAAGSDAPTMRDLVERIENCEKPVIAAFDGDVLGAGFEVFLAARFRVAGPGLRIGAPELRFGVTPGAGLSQRLPRLVGAERTFRFLLGGKLFPARDPALTGVFDIIADGPVRQTALLFARDLPAFVPLVRERTHGFKDMVAYQAAVLDMRSKLGEAARPTLTQLVELIEAAPLLPFDAGMDMEQEIFADSLNAPETRALRHLVTTETRLSEAMVKDSPRRQVVALLGANALSVQMAALLLNAGFALRWGAAKPDRLSAARKALSDLPGTTPERLASVTGGSLAEAVEGANAVLLATPNPLGVPVAPGTAVVDLVPGPKSPLGLRFSTPLRTGRVVEKLVRDTASAEQAAWLDTFISQLGCVAVSVRPGRGNLSQRLAQVLNRAADGLVDMGADPFEIDAALEAWGFARGPFLQRDILGLASYLNAPRAEGAANWSALLLDQGRKGRLSGQGFYDWAGGKPSTSDATRAFLDSQRPAKAFGRPQLVQLIVAALANEAAKYLRDGVIGSAAELDVLATDALKIDRIRGGVFFAVAEDGMLAHMRALRGVDHPDTALWTPIPLWAELTKNGRSFLTGP